jgi:arylsulfatase A-like enzyme
MTGRSPIRLGVVYATIKPFDDHGLPLDEHFMPQTLQAAGYETAMIGREAMPLIRGRDKSKPLFLYVPFNAPYADRRRVG